MSAPATRWQTLPLAGPGRSLVEASAGTGKTWTIAVLYLRLLLEQGLMPRRIIVSTFTRAAAAELGERLRAKLLWAIERAEAADAEPAPAATEEPADAQWLRLRWQDDPARRWADRARLQAALSELDAAPVSTLHALCSRILAEHPFAAGALFRGRELVDGNGLAAQLADDLWRRISQDADGGELATLAREAGIGRRDMQAFVPILLQAGIIVAADGPLDLREALRGLPFLDDLEAWATAAEALVARFTSSTAKLRRAWPLLFAALRAPVEESSDLLDAVVILEGVEQQTGIVKAGKTDPAMQALVRQTRQILDALPQRALDLRAGAAQRRFLAAAQAWCREALRARLEAAGQSTFDALVENVREALAPRDGRRVLADALFEAWPAALVDEFQDTDPQQFALLDAIYRDAAGAPRGRLVMIGDPKQAIYRFRGGDIAAYERAKADVAPADRLSLDTNFRSSSAYVEAVNTFYAATRTTLGPVGSGTPIRFEPVQPSGRRDGTPLVAVAGAGAIRQPLQLHVLDVEAEGGDEALETRALRSCAGQIAALLSRPGASLGGRPLVPGDIAVLLPGNAQVKTLAALLKARGVPCVTGQQDSVFASATARELRVLLDATLHPEDPRLLRAAIASRLWGADLRDLQRLREDGAALEAQAQRFHALHGLLQQRGPLAVVGAVLEQHAARLLASREGERRATDLRHLGELLQELWQQHGSGERLMAAFARRMDGDDTDAEAVDARALRLESDAARVQLMTLHASKGLEFNLVFLPLMWRHKGVAAGRGKPLLLALDDGSRLLVGGAPFRAQVAQQEFEERFRLLYVALTRAIHACHLFLAVGVERQGEVPLNTLDPAALQAAAALPDARLAWVPGWAEHEGVMYRPGDDATAVRQARPLPPAPRGPLPMRHSFTTLSGKRRHGQGEEERAAEDEAPDLAADPTADPAADLAASPAATPRVEVEAEAGPGHAVLDALAGVGGASFGNAAHALLETRVPGRAITAAAALDALRAHGVRPRHGGVEGLAAVLAERLNAVLRAPLAGADGPCLGDLAAADQRAEMAFHYALDGASLAALRAACERHGEPGLVPARDLVLAGLMNGKIDLVFAHGGRFHLLDYKGNQLARGPRATLADYAPEALEQAMRETGYRFQALLYSVALERHLRERLGADYRRDRHLGDCWYLFLRAVGLRLPDGMPCGIWRHRFGDALLDAVQAVLSTGRECA